MSNDASSARSNRRKLPQSLPNENEFDTSSNHIPLLPSRPPLNSIPDPSQYQSKTPPQQFHHGDSSKAASTSKKSEGITHTHLISSFIKTPTVHNKGKSAHSEPNSAQTTPIRSGPRLSNTGAAPGGCTLSRLPLQSSNAAGRAGAFPRVSRGISIGIPEQISADVPNFELEEDPLFWKDHNVQVLIRIRPLNSTEMMSQGYRKCLHQESAQTVVWLGHPESRFTFDHIACESVSQEKLFRVAGLPMVDNCISGYNSCMFAYGQTGSGKTYTMMGEFDKMDGELSNDCGITPRIFEYLFTRITKEEESRKHERLTFSCKCSFLEIYNEQITDLLEPSSTNLQLREDSKKGVYVENLTEYSVGTVNDVLKLLQQGAVNRKIAATHMNSESSRSHSVFTCIIESRWEKDSMAHFRFGRLNLVDLAGSERQKSSGAEGDRLREAANINKSLSTLGLVIMSLVDLAHGKHRHVPYRDSRLTFLLQDSLGGNSKTTIIANVSPSTCSANETLSTLKFAQRAKLIQNNAKINEDASGNVIALQQQIQQLKGQLSFLMKHQHASELLDFAPSPRKYSLCYLPERYELNEELNMYDEPNTPKGEIMKMKTFKANLLGSLRREKLAEMEVKRLKAEIEHLNRLAHQREEEAQCTKMMLRFREEKIKRMETLSNGLISADKFYLDENNALKEENLLLQAKIEKNPEVTRFALENIRLLEQIKMFQDFYEKGERETLLAEISELHNQLLESLELETSYSHHQFSPMKRYQETGNSKELERCKDMNSKLIREVDELRYQLENRMNCSQDTSNSIENVLPRSDSVDEATSSNLPGDEVIYEKSDKQMEDILDLQCDNVQKRLMDAQSLIETMKLGQFQLIRELESFQAENECLKKMLDMKEIPQRGVEAKQEDYRRKQSGIGNQDPTVPGSDDTSIAVLQSKLDKLSRDLNEAEILNRKYVEDHATRLSQDHQTELVRNEVEMETTKAIIELQEEMDRLQSEFQEQLCSMAEQNLILQNSVAAKDNELRTLSAEWERATLELTTFLIDGSRSLRDASRQIKCISSSFPNVKYWISEHVERAAKRCLEKEETILVLQKSLEDAQMTVMEMEQKLYSLKGATIALTEFQQPQKSSSIEEIQFSTMSNEPTEENEFPENKTLSKKGQIIHNQANAPILVENRSNYPTSTLSGIVERNLPLAHTNVFEGTDVDDQIKLTRLILSEIEEAVNGSYSDAEAHWFHLNSDIHNAVTLYKELVQNLLNDVSDMRKDINELKKNRGSLQFSNDTSQLHVPLKHENQLQMLEQIRNELVETNGRLNSMNACFHKVINMHCNLGSTEDLSETDGWTTDCSSLCSYSSVGSVDDDDKSSTSEKHRCTSKTTEQTLDLISDERSTLSHRRSVLLLRHEFRKTYGAFVKLNNHLMRVYGGKMDQNRMADILSFPDPHAIEKLKEQGRDGHDEPTSQRVETGSQTFEELAVAKKHSPPSSFFAKFEEAYATIKEADYMLRAMLTANENANMTTAMWKQAREELMSDKASLTEEIKLLKSCILLRDGEKEVLQDEIQSSLREKANILSLLEEHLPPIQSGDATQVVQETQAFFCRLRSSLEDLMCKEMQKDISIFVLQCQMKDHLHRLGRLNTVSNSDKSALLEHSLIADKLEIGHLSQDHNSVFHPLECESKGGQIAYVLGREIKELDLVHDDTVHKNSDLKRELERKDILLKGLLFDFSLLQELASNKNDIKYELEKLIVALSKVQNELEVKTVQVDDLLVQNTKHQGCLAEAEHSLFNSNSELDQAKGTLNILSEQNVELKGLLQDLYLKNSEAEHLLEEQREVIESLEKEIIRVSSSSDKQLAPSLKDIEDNLTRVTAERNELLEKLTSLQDKLDMACTLADENQAIAVEARQESEASKMYAEQKEEEVKILEHSVEELESTINVLEKKVHEMEEEVEKQRLIRDSLEVQLQELKHRLLTVEDLTESMTSEKSSLSVPEDKLSRKLHFKSLEVNEARIRTKFLEEENTKQAKEIKQFKDYISELVLHAEAQASQFQQKYKTLETMLHKVNTDSSNLSAAPTLERSDKISTKTRGSSSPFRCIAGLVQHMNQEKDQELSIARLRIEELEAQAASSHREVCMLNTRLATAESMTHDVIRDLLNVKLDLSNYANIIDQHQLQKLIEEAQHQRQEYFAMEHETVNLRSQIDDLLEERERCLLEINKTKSDQLGTQIFLEQLKERDQMLIAQNDMLKMDKSNLQKRVAELDDMVKKLITIQDSQPHNRPQRRNSLSMPYGSDLDERLTHSQKVLSRINNQLAQYGRPEGTCPHDKMDRHGNEVKFRKQKP